MTWAVEWVDRGGEMQAAEWDGRKVSCTLMRIEHVAALLLRDAVQPVTPTGPWVPSISDEGSYLAFLTALGLTVGHPVPSFTLQVDTPTFSDVAVADDAVA